MKSVEKISSSKIIFASSVHVRTLLVTYFDSLGYFDLFFKYIFKVKVF